MIDRNKANFSHNELKAALTDRLDGLRGAEGFNAMEELELQAQFLDQIVDLGSAATSAYMKTKGDRLEDALRQPQAAESYQDAEGFTDQAQEIMADPDLLDNVLRQRDSGVVAQPDGTIKLRWEGQNE